MPIVIDASVTAAWILPDETHPVAEECANILTRDDALVPAIWWFEVRNLLVMAERRQRISHTVTTRALDLLARYPIVQDHSADEATLMSLARQYQLTVYDAAYLELALRMRAPLATLDRELSAAAVEAGATVLQAEK